ncbi:hypothetical protein [Sediminicurvatus halobius]|uniref:hypothetical protein n=1 Tax=Sediminicurvatus halobius TaxID=2182432 RepID=UPI0011B238A6|nr:hypothetical protein [Spiribacter halobius]UEX78622.1 hypothetical protein LMH63_02965 [Spiribacter halobius]
MTSQHFGHRLSAIGESALREIVRDCLRANGLGADLPEERAISAAIELIENGFVRLEYDGESYRMEVVE